MPQAIPDKIPCESVGTFVQELAILREALSHPETEETWDRIARALIRFSAVVKGGGYKFERELVDGVKTSAKPIISAMNSERTRLSAAALDCIGVIAPRIGQAFEALVSFFIPHILRLANRPNKVYVTRSQATLALILGYCCIPTIIPQLLTACKESKIVTGRAVALEGVLRCLNKWNWTERDLKARAGDVEEIIRITGRDKDAGIRQTSRKVFEAYKVLFPDRVEEFTGPLTPIMRKYLDIKPLPKGQKPTEELRPPPAAEKPKRLPSRPEFTASTSSVPSSTNNGARTASMFHARSASSNAVIEASSAGNSDSNDLDGSTGLRAMAPPADIPSHSRAASRSQDRSHKTYPQDERQRVVSTASSTYSIKSAPPVSNLDHAHRRPMRLIVSQSQSSRANPVTVGSSGQARRVRGVVPVEPHPANRPDAMELSHIAPLRPVHLRDATGPEVPKAANAPLGEGLRAAPSESSAVTGVKFPTSYGTPFGHKGAQRVPKPVSNPTPASPPKMQRSATAMGVPSKRGTKPSIFRRGIPGTSKDGVKEIEKNHEGFAPRRGGGVTQPTLSQLNKQKAPVLASSSHASKPRVVSGRPAWGGGVSRTGLTRDPPVSRGQGREGISQAQSPKLAEKSDARPNMVSCPYSPGHDREVMPTLVPLPTSPKTEVPSDVNLEESTHSETMTAEVPEVKRIVEKTPQVKTAESGLDVMIKASGVPETTISEVVVDPRGAEQEVVVETQTTECAGVIQETTLSLRMDSSISQTPSAPLTPPFPLSDEESEADELEKFKFASGTACVPNGTPGIAPQKLGALDADVLLERHPLGDIALNG